MRFFIFCGCLFFSLNSFANSFQEKHFDPFINRVTDTTSLQLLVAGTASVLAVKPSDDQIRNDHYNNQKMSESNSHLGDMMGSGLVGALTLGGQYFFDGDENHYQSHARSLVYNTIVTGVMKVSFGRQRPGNSDSHQSFPSGHTSTAFATATSLTYAYGWKAAVVAYPLAAFVGLSRLADDAHWASDVVGGAFVGFIIARASAYEIATDSSAVQFFPVLDGQLTGLGLVYNF